MTKAVMVVNKDDPSKDKILSFRTSVAKHTKDIGISSDTASVEFNGATYLDSDFFSFFSGVGSGSGSDIWILIYH